MLLEVGVHRRPPKNTEICSCKVYRRKKMSLQRERSLCRILVHAVTKATVASWLQSIFWWNQMGLLLTFWVELDCHVFWMTPRKKYGDTLCFSFMLESIARNSFCSEVTRGWVASSSSSSSSRVKFYYWVDYPFNVAAITAAACATICLRQRRPLIMFSAWLKRWSRGWISWE